MSTTDKEGRIHIEDDEAMAAQTTGHVRWILGISLVAAIVILSLIWITGALSQGDVEEEATLSASEEIFEDEGSDIDGIVEEETEAIVAGDAAPAE